MLGTERVVDHAVHATVLVIDPAGARVGLQDKVQLDPSEDDTYTPGTGRRVFEIGALTFGVAICHEGWRYPETVRWAVRHGAQLVFHPHLHEAEGSFRPTTFGDPANTFHEHAVRCRAAENTCYIASVNYASAGSSTTSAIAGPDGTLLAYQTIWRRGIARRRARARPRNRPVSREALPSRSVEQAELAALVVIFPAMEVVERRVPVKTGRRGARAGPESPTVTTTVASAFGSPA